MITPLLTAEVYDALLKAKRKGVAQIECSLDLGRSKESVRVEDEGWVWRGRRFPYPKKCRERTIYYWADGDFEPVQRFTAGLIKLVPTPWGPPTFEIDGIKMLPTATISPYADAEAKVRLIEPRGKVILDTCGGLGYFAACCFEGGAAKVVSYEKNPDVVWLRSLNPWSPGEDERLEFALGDVSEHIGAMPGGSFDAILHDPPRFGIAGELYSQVFYNELARVLHRGGRLFHYTGTPNKLTSGRNVPNEVAARLRKAGFDAQIVGDGILATKL